MIGEEMMTIPKNFFPTNLDAGLKKENVAQAIARHNLSTICGKAKSEFKTGMRNLFTFASFDNLYDKVFSPNFERRKNASAKPDYKGIMMEIEQIQHDYYIPRKPSPNSDSEKENNKPTDDVILPSEKSQAAITPKKQKKVLKVKNSLKESNLLPIKQRQALSNIDLNRPITRRGKKHSQSVL